VAEQAELWGDAQDPVRKPLSARETEVLRMVARGLTNTEIADRLHVTVHAVKFHLAAVYRKLGVANRTEAAVVYLSAGSELTNQPNLPQID
jgi:DNA-binding NarL/FixJ family response regulator